MQQENIYYRQYYNLQGNFFPVTRLPKRKFWAADGATALTVIMMARVVDCFLWYAFLQFHNNNQVMQIRYVHLDKLYFRETRLFVWKIQNSDEFQLP